MRVAIALTAAGIVVVLVPLTPAGVPVLASSVAALIVLKR